MAGNGFSVNPLGLFAKPFHEPGTVEDLALGLGQRLAHLGGQDARQIVGMGDHQIEPAAQEGGAVPRRAGSPELLRRLGGGDGAGGLGAAAIGHPGDGVAARRVADRESGAAVGRRPSASQKGAVAQQIRIVEHGGKIGAVGHVGPPGAMLPLPVT